ncbi:MAG: hypothetical protein H3C31_10385 [Brumimicrobium sp.]|nr:hypothetical protein [Brumimicrobium sp.]
MKNINIKIETEPNDFSVLFEKLNEEISNQSVDLTNNLNISKDTLDTISYFKEFQESVKLYPQSYFSRSI